MRRYVRTQALFAVILGMLALGIVTWGIGKVYVELVGGTSTGNTIAGNQPTGSGITAGTASGSSKNATLVLPAVDFWICQVGIFSTAENAQTCLNHLQQLSYQGGVIKTNPWVVGVGLGHADKDLAGLKQAMAAQGIPTVIKKVSLPERTFRVAGNGSDLTMKLLLNANTLIQKGVSSQGLLQEKQAWDALAQENTPAELKQLHQVYNLLRAQKDPGTQKILGLNLFLESTRIINLFSGK